MNFGYALFFYRGTAFLLGKFNGQPFSCYSKSGSQNLWLPFREKTGLKVCHPKGFSGTLDKVKIHYDAQMFLAKKNLAPKPLELFEINLSFVKCSDPVPPWICYGIMMERVLNGNVSQILRNLELFGVENNRQTRAVVNSFVRTSGSDALTLMDYTILCKYFGVLEEKRFKKIIDGIKNKLPSSFHEGPDLLTPTNVVLDGKGKAKVVDCDLSSL